MRYYGTKKQYKDALIECDTPEFFPCVVTKDSIFLSLHTSPMTNVISKLELTKHRSYCKKTISTIVRTTHPGMPFFSKFKQ